MTLEPWIWIAAKAVFAVGLYLPVDWLLNRWCSQDHPLVSRRGRSPVRLILLVGAGVGLSVGSALGHPAGALSASERLFLWAAVLPLLNATSAAPFNFVLGRPQHGRRALMLAACLGVGLLPWLVPAVLILFGTFVPGLTAGLKRSFTDLTLPLAALTGHAATATADALIPTAPQLCHPATLSAIVAAFYVIPAWAKLRAGWTGTNRLGCLGCAAAFQWNWQVRKANQSSRNTSWPLSSRLRNSLVVLAELAMAAGPLSAAATGACAAIALVFHTVVAHLTGIVFWEWAVVWVGLAGWAAQAAGWDPATTVAAFGVGFMVSLFARLPDRLTWFDSPLVHRYLFWGETADGTRHLLPPQLFAPFEILIAQGRFHFLRRQPTLQGCLGSVTNRELARALYRARDAAEIEILKKTHGSTQHCPNRSRALRGLLHAFLIMRYQPASTPFFWARWLPRINRLPTGWPDPNTGPYVAFQSLEVRYQEAWIKGGSALAESLVDEQVLLVRAPSASHTSA